MSDTEYSQFVLFQKRDHLSDLQHVCSSARTIEEIVLGWCDRGRTIVAALNPELPWPAIGFTFMQGRKAMAMANVNVDRILPSYPSYDRIADKVIQFCDQPGFLPDHDWFEKRNERLGIFADTKLRMNRVPAAALGELVLSYALSQVGFSEITYGKKLDSEQYLKLSLIYFGPDVDQENSGWYENGSVSLRELREYIPKALWV